MPQSEFRELAQRLRKILAPENRYVDIAFRFRVMKRNKADTAAIKGRLLPEIYGGRYDTLTRRYLETPPEKIVELECHEGQLELLLFDEPGVLRYLALGAPGGGKTFAAVARAWRNIADRPNSSGGIVAPTNDARQVVWDAFLAIGHKFDWIKDVITSKKRIITVNNVEVDVLAGKRPSAAQGSPVKGRSWDWAVADESHAIEEYTQREIDARGRRAGLKFRCYETATNEPHAAFQMRLKQYEASPKIYRIGRYRADLNAWVEKGHWDRLRETMPDREFRMRYLGEDLPAELLIYGRFKYEENVCPRPKLGRDVTEDITGEKYGNRYRYVAATDYGALTTCSVILKAYAGKDGSRLWWAIDEIFSYQTTSDVHAQKLLSRYAAEDVIVVCDPHFNSKDSDKSDMHLMRKEGLHVTPATFGKIARKHRLSMMNTLLENGRGERSLFVDCDEKTRRPACPKLVEAFMSLQYNEHGEAEKDKKDANDKTHAPAAVGYGVFPWEAFRGGGVQVLPIQKRPCDKQANDLLSLMQKKAHTS